MIIKRSKVEIVDVASDLEHNIDDEGTHKALAEAKKTYLKNLDKDPEQESKRKDSKLEN